MLKLLFSQQFALLPLLFLNGQVCGKREGGGSRPPEGGLGLTPLLSPGPARLGMGPAVGEGARAVSHSTGVPAC